MNRIIFSVTISSLLVLAACSAPREYYGVTSDQGSMIVTSLNVAKSGSVTLDAKTPVLMLDGDKPRSADINAEQLRGRFARALQAQPLPPKRFTLYFVEGGDTLTAESQAAISAIFDEIKKRPAPDLVVVGHSDRVGSVAANDQLAAKRANTMRDQLIKLGVDAENIQASGRGEREPLVPTADEVAEPQNRRVEILVR